MARKGFNIYKRKDNRWEGRFKRPDTGKLGYVYGKTYNEARKKVMDSLKEPIVTRKCGFTVKELFELWLCRVRHKVKDSSYANYLTKLELHIFPAFGSVNFDALTSKHIDDFVHEKLSNGRIGGGRLSVKYVSDMVVLFKSLGKFAEREYGCNNPIKNASSPKTRRKELIIPPKNEQKALSDYLLKNPTPRNLGILLCLFTGIRLGELCALRWADIDFSEKTVAINKTVQRVKRFDGKSRTELVINSPKSEKSNRVIPLQGFILKLLSKQKKSPNCYILSGTDKLIEPRLMQYYFESLLKKAKLPSINFHSTRHIFATNCLAYGFDVKTLSEILGHATVELTLNRYVHSSKERQRECMEKLRLISPE